jgi:monovalent cation/hydrogen antiporter
MFQFEMVIILITLIVLFSYMAEAINIPYPIVLLLLGLGLGYIPNVPHITIPREMLLPLFLPPILFWGALLTNWHEFRRHWFIISSLGVLLVLITSFLVAFVISSLFPLLGFIPALLLGAVISPSDAVCATAILSRVGLSARIISILEGESLINDAAGIVLYNFALSMLLFGTSDFNHPLLNFFVVAVGGVVLGGIIGLLFAFIFHHLSHKKDSSLPIIVSLIIPFIVFHVGEILEVSSVLAVVSAGMCVRIMGDRNMDAHSRLRGLPVWDTFIFILNGLIFIILGLEFPEVIKKTMEIIPAGSLFELTLAVLISIVFMRIAWVYISAKFVRSTENWKESLVVAWSGMRGIVSLALALSIPTVDSSAVLEHGDVVLFVTREVILFVTVVTILFTIIVQGLSLPWLIRKLKISKSVNTDALDVLKTFKLVTQNTIDKIEEDDFGEEAYSQESKVYLLNYYQNRLHYHKIVDEYHVNKLAFHQIFLQYYRYERHQLRHLYSQGKIDMEIFSRLMNYLDMEETKHLS